MADTPPPTPPVPPAPPPAPWHQGIDADTLGFWQNKGLDTADPKVLAAKLTEQYRGLEKHIGAPPERIIRLPDKTDDKAGWDGVWSKLGVPAEAKDYDFAGIKHTDGKDVDAALTDALRAALHTARTPKDRAPDVIKAVVKSLDDRATQEATVLAGKLAEEKATLAKNWGPNAEFNRLKAMEGARRAGVSPEGVAALENQIGYAATMELFRRIGSGTSEDMWHDGNKGPAGHPTTLEGAQSQLKQLESDKEWGKRLRAGDAATVAQWTALTNQIAAAA